MPAGLLLSPTAQTVRSGPGIEPSRRRCRRPQVPLPHRQERPAARLGKVPWELSPSPSCAVRRRGCSCGAFRSYRPQSRLPPAPIPGKMVGAKARPQAPHPRQGPAMASLPCLGRHASFPAPSHGSIAPGVFLRPLSQAILPLFFPCRTSFAAVRPSLSFQARRLCAQPAFFQPSRHLCAKKNDFVKKNANTSLSPPSLPDKSACSPPESPPKTGPKNRKNQEITDFFRQSALTSPAKHVSVFSIAAGLQAVLGITCGVSVTFERVFFHVQVHLCWEPPLGRY